MSELPKDVVDQANALSAKLAEGAMREAARSIAESFVAAMGGPEAANEFAQALDQRVKELLSPELAAESDAVNAAIVELAKRGQSIKENPELLQRFLDLQQNSVYVAAVEKATAEFFAMTDEATEEVNLALDTPKLGDGSMG